MLISAGSRTLNSIVGGPDAHDVMIKARKMIDIKELRRLIFILKLFIKPNFLSK